MDGDTKDDLLIWYKEKSPDAIGIEDDDGTFYPKEIRVLAIVYVPPAESHILRIISGKPCPENFNRTLPKKY